MRQAPLEAMMIFFKKNRGTHTIIETCAGVDEQDIVVRSRKVNNPKTKVSESLFDGLDPDTTLGVNKLVELDGQLPHTLQGSCPHMFEDIELRTFNVHLY